MVILNNRLNKIASFVRKNDKVADIGSDHALIPIFLFENKISENIIITDVNKGPLEKAKTNIVKHLSINPFEMRCGDGIMTIEQNEVDTLIIAGMGGLLIKKILGDDINKCKSINKIILQPRNSSEELRTFLFKNNFPIIEDVLAIEGKFYCEIIVLGNKGILCENYELLSKDKLFGKYILKKIQVLEKIKSSTENIDKKIFLDACKKIDFYRNFF